MKLKPSCKSQFLSIADEVIKLLNQGYSKKTVYDYFVQQRKIQMTYSSWTVVIRHQYTDNPFSRPPQKTKKLQPKIADTTGQNSQKKGFSHPNTPYQGTKSETEPAKTQGLKVNIITKDTMLKEDI